MKNEKADQEFKAIFQEWKKGGDPNTPAFEDIWRKAILQKDRRKKIRRVVLLSSAAVFTLLLGFYFLTRNPSLTQDQLASIKVHQWQAPTDKIFSPAATSLSNWKAPTSILLETSYQTLSLQQQN